MYLIIIAIIFGLVYFSFNTIKVIIFNVNKTTEENFVYFREWFLILLIINIFLLLSILFYYYYYMPKLLKGNKGPIGYRGDKGHTGDSTITCDRNLEC